MKKLLLLFMIPFLSFGQTLNNILIEDLDVKYIQIVGEGKLLKNYEVTVYVSYGQVGSFKDAAQKKNRVFGRDGKALTFNGMMDAVNFFSNYGYELVFAYPIANGVSGGSVYHYVMYNSEAKNTNANDVFNNKGNWSSDELICECNENLKAGIPSSAQCQELFKNYNLSSKAGKIKFQNDLDRLSCK